MRFSTSNVFHDSNPSGPLKNRLKYSIFEFCGDDLCAHHRDDLSGVQHTVVIISVVCNTPRSQSRQCAAYRGDDPTHRGDDLRGAQQQNQNRNLHLSMVAFKETIRRNPFRGEHIYHEIKDFNNFFLFDKKML